MKNMKGLNAVLSQMSIAERWKFCDPITPIPIINKTKKSKQKEVK